MRGTGKQKYEIDFGWIVSHCDYLFDVEILRWGLTNLEQDKGLGHKGLWITFHFIVQYF